MHLLPDIDGHLMLIEEIPEGLAYAASPRPSAASRRERAPRGRTPRNGAGTRRATGVTVPALAPRQEAIPARPDALHAGNDPLDRAG